MTIFDLVFTIVGSMMLGWWAKGYYDMAGDGAKRWQEREQAEREQAEHERNQVA